MRSRRGLLASIALLLALPLTALSQMVLGAGVEAVIHGALALGSALMAFAVFDFKTPRWATWMGSISTGVLAAVFFLQALSEVTHDEALTYLAYRVLGQRLEGWLVNLFMAWCVVVLVVDSKVTGRFLASSPWLTRRPQRATPGDPGAIAVGLGDQAQAVRR